MFGKQTINGEQRNARHVQCCFKGLTVYPALDTFSLIAAIVYSKFLHRLLHATAFLH